MKPTKLIPDTLSIPKKQSAMWVAITPTWHYYDISTNRHDNILIEKITQKSALSNQRLGIQLQAGLQIPLTTNINLQISGSYKYIPTSLQLEAQQWVKDSVRFTSLTTTTYLIEPNLQKKQWNIKETVHQFGISVALEQQFLLSKNWFTGLQVGMSAFQSLSKTSFFQTQQTVLVDTGLSLHYRLNSNWLLCIRPKFSYPIWQSKPLNSAPFSGKAYEAGLQLAISKNLGR